MAQLASALTFRFMYAIRSLIRVTVLMPGMRLACYRLFVQSNHRAETEKVTIENGTATDSSIKD